MMPTASAAGVSAPDLAGIARLLANDSRAAMLLALLDGRAWTAGELAAATGIARSTASEHLNLLADAELIEELRQGRHRYVRISSPTVAEEIESLAALSGVVRPARSSLPAQRADAAIREARTCYRHLAGRLGVDICDRMRQAGHVTDHWQLTASGQTWLRQMGAVLPAHSSRPLLRPCLDWTERRYHLAGTAADALLTAMLANTWLQPGPIPRALKLTTAGTQALSRLGTDTKS